MLANGSSVSEIHYKEKATPLATLDAWFCNVGNTKQAVGAEADRITSSNWDYPHVTQSELGI